MSLSAEFERLGPWVTKFTIESREYGGWFDGMNDARIQEFRNAVPSLLEGRMCKTSGSGMLAGSNPDPTNALDLSFPLGPFSSIWV